MKVDVGTPSRGTLSGSSLPVVSAVYGGGGPFGIAYAFGIVDTLLEAEAPLRTCPMLGTSAGAWVAAALATGADFTTLSGLSPVRVPSLHPGMLRELAEQVFGRRRSPLVRVGVVRLSTGRRVILDGAQHPLAQLVAASSAVPWLFAPQRVDGRTYVDGGVRSLTSADRASPARRLLVVAPVAGPMFGPGGRTMETLLRREIHRWELATGGTVELIRPNRAIARLARYPLNLFDAELAASVYPLARDQAQRLLVERPGLADLCRAPSTPAAA